MASIIRSKAEVSPKAKIERQLQIYHSFYIRTMWSSATDCFILILMSIAPDGTLRR